jgi:signal transduction histidine kinase
MPSAEPMRGVPIASLRRKLLAAFGSAALVLIVGAASLASVVSLRSAYRAVEHTRQVIEAADELVRALTDAETGQRGYLITGADRYLSSYRAGVPDVATALASLRQLAAGNTRERGWVDSLSMLSAAKLAELDTTIALRRDQGFAAAEAVVITDRGRSYMVGARRIAAELKTEELGLLRVRDGRQVRNAIITFIVIGAGSLVAFVLAALITQAIRVDVELREQDRVQIEAQSVQLQDQAAELEAQQVELEAQTDDLRFSNDDLQAANARAERALRAHRIALARVQRSNEELDQFAYVASHDLKAPLRGIANLATWLEEDLAGAITPAAREHLVLLRGRVQRMEALIDGILQYSRAGRVGTDTERVDVAALLREIIELLAPPADVTIVVGREFPVLDAERVPLQQVFLNLLANAIKYTRRAGAIIRVDAAMADGAWTFSVTDNGPGIAPEFHDRIFGIFQTLEPRDKVEGTGIGLSVVKKIVESRGGHVTLESAVAAGATFRFTWPERPIEES